MAQILVFFADRFSCGAVFESVSVGFPPAQDRCLDDGVLMCGSPATNCHSLGLGSPVWYFDAGDMHM